VAAVEPELAALRGDLGQAAPVEALETARPFGTGEARLESRGLELLEPGGAQGRDGRAGIGELMPPDKLGTRQVEETLLVLIDEAPSLLMHGEILLADEERGSAETLRLAE
jgi:hypothetical protein